MWRGRIKQRLWIVRQTAIPRSFAGDRRLPRAKAPSRRPPCGLEFFSQASHHLASQVHAARVDTCLRSFHRLSGSGPYGLKPLHVQDVADTSSRDELLEYLTALVNILARGNAPTSLAPYLAEASPRRTRTAGLLRWERLCADLPPSVYVQSTKKMLANTSSLSKRALVSP